jgi:hypothetical protein
MEHMSMISYPFSRLSELTREVGLKEALDTARRRAAAEAGLRARETWCSLTGRRLPSERRVLAGTSGDWSSLDDLVEYLCHSDSPAYLFSADGADDCMAQWQEAFPDSVQTTLRRADEICDLGFDLLGVEYHFGSNDHRPVEIDWHLDAASGRRWPMDHIERIDRWMWTDQRVGDYKPIWELNRHQYLAILGKAYWLTGDEKYAEACATQLESWIRANPYPFGINWYSALEVGIRLIAWGLAFQYFRRARRFVETVGKAFVLSLYQQTSFLRRNLTLEWAGRNNHIIGEAAALTFVGALFAEFAAAGEWQEIGIRIVEEEIVRQTHADGVNREQSPAYHRFVLDFVLLLIVLARRGAIRRSLSLETHAEKMLEYVMLALTPGGDLPLLGDADDGWGYMLSSCSVDESFRDSLSLGAVLFRRPDFKFAARNFGEGAFWLLGKEGHAAFKTLPAEQPARLSVAFPQTGQYVIRSDWTRDGDYALLRCGEFGLAGEGFCAHAHCDLLSPVLWIKGRPLLVDSGTYTYHGSWRDRFRLTAAHNTVLVDGEDQAVPTGPFSWQGVPEAHCEAWDGHRVVGSLILPGNVTFLRELVCLRPGAWLLNDRFEGSGVHRLEWAFHLASGLVAIPQAKGEKIIISDESQPGWAVVLEIPDVAFSIKEGWRSARYGEKTRIQVIRAEWHGSLSVSGVGFVWRFGLADGKAGNEEPA